MSGTFAFYKYEACEQMSCLISWKANFCLSYSESYYLQQIEKSTSEKYWERDDAKLP